jgi:small subunit ribosomal protein S4
MSDFGKQLQEKQKLRYTYWVSEGQFRNYVKKAIRQKGKTGENLLQILETRLDTMAYRLGFAPTVLAARQMITHGHILVNEKKVDTPSFGVRKGDLISIRDQSQKMMLVEEGIIKARTRPPLPYIEVDREKLQGRLLAMPSREEIPIPINESLVVEYYARRM